MSFADRRLRENVTRSDRVLRLGGVELAGIARKTDILVPVISERDTAAVTWIRAAHKAVEREGCLSLCPILILDLDGEIILADV